ncbi:MAG TPA: TIGR03118 family protein [Pirellulales bacterium]|nr:TIGR03118 family protein [Pirellulales bacterium]
MSPTPSLPSSSSPRSSRQAGKTPRSKKPLMWRVCEAETLEARNLLTGYMQMNLVSDQAGTALIQDPKLVAPWGISVAPDGNFWVADSGSSVATIYSGDVNGKPFAKDALVVQVPGGLPTGEVANGSGGFSVTSPDGSTGSSQVIFDSANGGLAGATSTLAQLAAQVDGAVYTGLAIGTVGGTTYLFAADFQNGTVDVFDTNFNLVTSLAANAHPGYSPFGVQVINDQLYVTYAKYTTSGTSSSDNDQDDSDQSNQGPQDEAPGNGNGNGQGNGNGNSEHGHQGHKGGNEDNDSDDGENNGAGPSGVRLLATTGGFVDAYSLGGLLNGGTLPAATWSAGTSLNAPWGLALAPDGFGDFGGDLLVGNFGDGHITALNATTGALVTTGTNSSGELTNPNGTPLVVNHLLGLTFGSGSTAGSSDTLYFTSAPNGSTSSTTSSDPSLIVLESSNPGALTVVGNANVAVSGGGTLAVDSSSSSAITASGNAQVAAGTIDVVGSTSTNGNANISGLIEAGASLVANPFASLQAPSITGLAQFQSMHISDHSHVTLRPGVYTGGIDVSGQASVFLMPGIYILQGGGLSISGGATVVGSGVMIFNSPLNANQGIHVTGHGSLNLSGPTSGSYKGIALFQAPGAGSPLTVDGQGSITVQGIIYAPSATAEISGNGQLTVLNDLDDSIQAQLIVFDLNVVGNGTVAVSGRGTGGILGIHGLLGSLQPATIAKPLVITGGVIQATEGTTFTGAVAALGAAAAGAVAGDFTTAIDWGDGTSSTGTVTATGNGGFLVLGHHDYAEEGTETVTVTVSDKSSHTVSSTASAQVADAPLVAAGINVPLQQSLTVNNLQIASVTDTGGAEAAADYTATIDWGDGTATTTGAVSVSGNTIGVAGSHSYTMAGRYHVSVTVTDEGGASTVVHSVVVVGNPPPDNLFVGSAFEDVLQRSVDQSSLQFFVHLLQGGAPRAAVALTLTHSAEYLDNLITQAYEHFLGRDPDDPGLAFWLSAMQNGLTLERLEADFIGSPEYFEHSGGTNQLFVDHMYFDLLGRAPETAGEAFWVNALTGGENRALVALGFAASAEHEGIIVRDDYLTYLNREPVPSEVSFWVNQFEHGMNNENVVAGFLASDEYFEAHD